VAEQTTKETPYRLVADEAGLRECLQALPAEGVSGLDTETFWNPSQKLSSVSLIQIATPAGELFVIDALALDLEPLRPFLESPSALLAAHNARFDQMVLAGAGFQPAGLVDTLQLSRAALSLPSHSLASVAEHLFGIALDKTLRTSNWRRRPLTRAQLAYAAEDARVALRVYEELKRILEEKGRWEEAARAALIKPPSGEEKPRRQRRARQELSPPLTAEEKSVVTRLKKWRLERSFTQKVPAYMICPDRTLEHLARERPETAEALAGIYGLGESKIKSFGEELLQALRDACDDS
jgi:ribonuclease D